MNNRSLLLKVGNGLLTWSHVPPQASVREVLWALQKLGEKLELREEVIEAVEGKKFEAQLVLGKERFVTGDGPVRFDLGIIRNGKTRDLFTPPLLNRHQVPLREILIVAEALTQRYFGELKEAAALQMHGNGTFSMPIGTTPQIDQLEALIGFRSSESYPHQQEREQVVHA